MFVLRALTILIVALKSHQQLPLAQLPVHVLNALRVHTVQVVQPLLIASVKPAQLALQMIIVVQQFQVQLLFVPQQLEIVLNALQTQTAILHYHIVHQIILAWNVLRVRIVTISPMLIAIVEHVSLAQMMMLVFTLPPHPSVKPNQVPALDVWVTLTAFQPLFLCVHHQILARLVPQILNVLIFLAKICVIQENV